MTVLEWLALWAAFITGFVLGTWWAKRWISNCVSAVQELAHRQGYDAACRDQPFESEEGGRV